ncbi:MAG: YfhO family protein, partial [Thermomicrobiales bacterium]
ADPSSGWGYFPAMAFYTVLPPLPATTVFLAFHLLLSAAAAYALARLTGIGPAAAAVAGLAYVLPWAVPAAASAVLMLQVTTWLPIALIGVEVARIASKHWLRLAGVALGGLAISQILAAWLGQAAYYSLLVIAGWIAWRTLVTPPTGWGWRARLLHCVLVGVGVVTTGVLLNAMALLIRLDANARSNTPGGDYTGISGWTDSLVGLSLPDALRELAGGFGTGSWLYVGAAVIALALLAPVLAPRWPPLLFWIITPIIAICLVLPEPTIVAKVAYAVLPRFEQIHTHLMSRVLMVAPLSVAMLAGASAQTLFAAASLPRWRVGAGVLAVAIVAVVAVLGWQAQLISRGAMAAMLAILGVAFLALILARYVQPQVLLIALAAIIVWDPVGRALLAGWGPGGGPERSMTAALGGQIAPFLDDNGAATFIRDASADDAGRYAGFDPSLLPRPSRHGELPPQAYRNAWLGPANWLLVQNWGTWFGIEDVQGYNPVHIMRYGEYIDALNGHRQEYHETDIFTPGIASPLLDLLNLRFFVVPANAASRRDLSAMATKLPVLYRDDNVLVIENPEALPRAWIVHEAQTLPDEQILPALASGSVDPRQTALLETTAPTLAQPPDAGAEAASYHRLSPEAFAVAATAASDGLLVTSEIWDPGWQATIDGRAAPVLRANSIFMTLALPPGEHTVEFRYVPPYFWLGMVLTAITALALLIGGVWLARRDRQRVLQTQEALG